MLKPGKFLDIDCPINWDWEGNLNLYGEWAVAPVDGWRGVPNLTNLARGLRSGSTPANNATLNAGAAWSGTALPGGYGSLFCTGGPYLGINLPAVGSTDDYSLVITHRPTTWPSTFTNIMGHNADWETSCDTNGGLSFQSGAILSFASGGTQAVNVWHQMVFCRIRSVPNSYFYIDGSLVANNGSTGINSTTSAGTVNFGDRFTNGSGSYYDGRYASVQFYKGRGLTQADVTNLWDQTRRGNPDRWRWVPTRSWFLPAAIINQKNSSILGHF